MIEHLHLLSDAGIDSFKIEGRMKGINYVAGVVKTYREAVDSLGNWEYAVNPRWLKSFQCSQAGAIQQACSSANSRTLIIILTANHTE